MWNKTYSIALAIAVLVMSSLCFYAYSWLSSIAAPVSVVQNYEYFSSIAWTFLWLSTIVLLILGNVLYWRIQQSWGLWATFLYFAAFIILQTFLFDETFRTFKNRNNLAETGLSFSPFFGVVLCLIGAIIIFFDQFLISRLHKKMFGVAPEEVKLESGEV